ncbi:alpha/beta hydrolase family protein [Nannocystis radixulma]|uniref:Alpha/beta hydrolase family protein n=1 Tax=Nannocystis radixulma TaxID=2995305 RepID=A0ABT5BGD6_9BACT|nr:hypothetical protein [Nannocystis radixulma]MDC0673190.1 hypothetical protein [Nannocystis radixulma]
MRWSPHLVAALVSFACNFDEDGSSASQGGGNGDGTTTTTTGEPTTGSELPPGFWPGVACAPPAEEQEGTPRIYFDLDAGKVEGRDFFRLPFPLDARLKGGGVDLSGFPSPPADLDPAFGHVVERWLSHLQSDLAGFAVNSAVLFRSTHGVDAPKGIVFVNIEAGHPGYGQKLEGLSYSAKNGDQSGNNYICRNWLAVETIDGVPLEPGVTYAVLLTDSMEPLGGGRFSPDADFSAMLNGSAPGDPLRKAAWDTFAPLRQFLDSAENAAGVAVTRDRLIGGTVFTTAANNDVLAGAREAVRSAPLWVSDLHACTAAGPSPCSAFVGLTAEERAERECGAASKDYREIHGRVRLPIFQEGVPPYADIGGRIDLEDGAPIQRSSLDACFSVTVPVGQAPEAGWPVLVYAHGTGGSFRSPIIDGTARALASRGFATIALEGVMHGERRNDSDDDGEVGGLDLDQLVFNVYNPESARDTLVQGAIDQFTAVRLAEEWQDSLVLGGEMLHFDASALFFMGHSQGANSGALFLPFEPLVRAAVLSGGGAKLPRALLGKQEPKVENPVTGDWLAPRELLQLAFQERPDRPLDTPHPMLILLNTFVNRSDADNTAPLIRRRPLAGMPYRHILNYMGHVDSYSPLRAAGNLAIGLGAPIAGANLFDPPCDDYADENERAACGWTSGKWLPEVALPVTGNVSGKLTAVTRMLPAPAGKDGHYVAFEPAEMARIAGFFASALADGVPTVE